MQALDCRGCGWAFALIFIIAGLGGCHAKNPGSAPGRSPQAKVTVRDISGQVAQAIEQGDLDVLHKHESTLHDLGVQWGPAENVYPVLTLACRLGSAEVVKVLLDAGCPVNVANRDGETPLGSALNRTRARLSVDIVEMLLDKGAPAAGAVYEDGTTALHLAALKRSPTLVELLLKRGSDVGARDGYGQSVLHIAIGAGDPAVVRLVLEPAVAKGLSTSERRRALGAADQLAKDAEARLRAGDTRSGDPTSRMADAKAVQELVSDRLGQGGDPK